ncbi:MAG: hypothetical protein M3Z54_04540 [Gemmatimonadota bacterium]|nr:hypothetical protein [Gemmatimonadota bacterium]
MMFGCTGSSRLTPERIKLPPGVDKDAGTFRNSIAGFAVTRTHDRLRPGDCKKCIVMIHIDVLGNTSTIDPGNPPAAGVPIAHLTNMDTSDSEDYYKLRPGRYAEYYVWVDDKGGKKSRATLLEVSGNSVTAKVQWDLIICHLYPARYVPKSDFDFYEYHHSPDACRPKYTSVKPPTNLAGFSAVAPFSKLFVLFADILSNKMSPLQGDWIECSSGCCT